MKIYLSTEYTTKSILLDDITELLRFPVTDADTVL